MITQGVVLYQPTEPLVVEDLEIPKLLPGQVLVEIAFSGVCHTQLLEVEGKRGPDRFLPHCLGHEASGTVLETGSDVRKVKMGDQVVLSWIASEGATAPGPVYRTRQGVKVNAGPVATFLKHAVVAENRCTKLESNVPLDVAALWGCALPTGSGMVFRQLPTRAGQSLVILGAGGIGLSSLLAAVYREYSPIIVVDISKEKLEFAKGLGATHVLFFHPETLRPLVLELTGGRGADLVLEASGNRTAMEAAVMLARDKGGRVCFAGNPPHGEKISIDPFALIYGRSVTGSAGGESRMSEDVPLFERLYGDAKFPMEKLLTERFPLEEINSATARLRSGAPGRLLVF